MKAHELIAHLLTTFGNDPDSDIEVVVDIGCLTSQTQSWYNTGHSRNTHVISGIDTDLVPGVVILEL